MATDSPRRDYNVARSRLDERHDEGLVSDADYERITELLDAFDGECFSVPTPDDGSKEPTTLKSYCSRYTWVSHRMEHATLTTATTADINAHMEELLTGENPHIKDDGFSKNTVSIYQSALRTFYKFHDDLDVEPTDIVITQPNDTSVDETQLFDADDVRALRNATTNSRDDCLIELLLNTGQRVRAIQTLRIKDIFLDEVRFRLNPEVDGLKHAEGNRPLLGAEAAVRRCINHHPTGDRDDYLITVLHDKHEDSEFGQMLHRSQIRRRLITLGERAGIEKPVNPHNFRHFAVTEMYRRYDMDPDTIKWMIGHSEDSRVMETTYRHLTDEDYAQRAEVAAGIRDEIDGSDPLLPPKCPMCHEATTEGDKFCSHCGVGLTPNAEQTRVAARQELDESKGEARATGDEEGMEAIDKLKRLLDEHPELSEEL